jgi:hypothetical protein
MTRAPLEKKGRRPRSSLRLGTSHSPKADAANNMTRAPLEKKGRRPVEPSTWHESFAEGGCSKQYDSGPLREIRPKARESLAPATLAVPAAPAATHGNQGRAGQRCETWARLGGSLGQNAIAATDEVIIGVGVGAAVTAAACG